MGMLGNWNGGAICTKKPHSRDQAVSRQYLFGKFQLQLMMPHYVISMMTNDI